jgi:hypothetical protein
MALHATEEEAESEYVKLDSSSINDSNRGLLGRTEEFRMVVIV